MAFAQMELILYKSALALADEGDIRSYLDRRINCIEFISRTIQNYHVHVESTGTIMETMSEEQLKSDCQRQLVGRFTTLHIMPDRF